MPAHRSASGKTYGLFARVSKDVKEDFEDIRHALDMKTYEALSEIIRYYKKEKRVEPRPSRKRAEQG